MVSFRAISATVAMFSMVPSALVIHTPLPNSGAVPKVDMPSGESSCEIIMSDQGCCLVTDTDLCEKHATLHQVAFDSKLTRSWQDIGIRRIPIQDAYKLPNSDRSSLHTPTMFGLG
ncbi:hypothetical protein F4825DRAFT_451728 [Nemania diffusa]|nr:hypothetical protein F4825DRAFT_451728 [Nemania diffusa]